MNGITATGIRRTEYDSRKSYSVFSGSLKEAFAIGNELVVSLLSRETYPLLEEVLLQLSFHLNKNEITEGQAKNVKHLPVFLNQAISVRSTI